MGKLRGGFADRRSIVAKVIDGQVKDGGDKGKHHTCNIQHPTAKCQKGNAEKVFGFKFSVFAWFACFAVGFRPGIWGSA